MLINSKVFLQFDSIIFDVFGQACPNFLGKFAISLWRPRKVRNEVRDLTALAGSNAALTMLPQHWPFSSLNMESIPNLFFIWLTVCVT